MMKGSVTISLADFKKLENAQGNAVKQREGTLRAAKELEVFLSFLCSRETITPLVEEFNRQSRTCSIHIDGGRAKIKFNEETNDKG